VITVLVVGPRDRAAELDAAATRNPSIELLHATGLEETLDRLARNRRIDAVLLLVEPGAAREIAETVLEEDPAAPPLFLPGTAKEVAGARALAGSNGAEILAAIASSLSS
jgi:hypothetical protein